ncbi:MAG: succinylglutamate desuccinylase/aspartoacylase family protein [Proteobacteria bacterium]|nr:succinylglutamate desuccinylase/aspartoacylase family protein [Pseudomonadota bacterium]MBI3496964.1 succinylglutamate desuccinylase/aspartoacylase family protein [Pseudomonadota bacterium]
MASQHRIIRPKFTTYADGCEAVLTMHEIVGEADGPTVGISGAIHGNEPTGTEIILDLYRTIKNMRIKGRLLLLPVANPRAFAANRRCTPTDDLNLNREFPGDAKGTYTQQLAAAITGEFLEKIDVHIDFHSGTDRPTVDYVYIWSDEALSRSFGSKVLFRPMAGKEGTVYAGTTKAVTLDRRNIPVVVVELGGGIVDQKPYVERGLAGALNMLRQLGVIEGEVVPPPPQVVVRSIAGVRPTQAGLIENLAPPLGERIRGRAPIFRVISPYTFEVLQEVASPYENGIMIMGHLGRNLVESGDYGYMIGDLEGAET